MAFFIGIGVFFIVLILFQVNFFDGSVNIIYENDQSSSWQAVFDGNNGDIQLDPFQMLALYLVGDDYTFGALLAIISSYFFLAIASIAIISRVFDLKPKAFLRYSPMIIFILDPILLTSVINLGKDMFSFFIGVIVTSLSIKIYKRDSSQHCCSWVIVNLSLFLIYFLAFFSWRKPFFYLMAFSHVLALSFFIFRRILFRNPLLYGFLIILLLSFLGENFLGKIFPSLELSSVPLGTYGNIHSGFNFLNVISFLLPLNVLVGAEIPLGEFILFIYRAILYASMIGYIYVLGPSSGPYLRLILTFCIIIWFVSVAFESNYLTFARHTSHLYFVVFYVFLSLFVKTEKNSIKTDN